VLLPGNRDAERIIREIHAREAEAQPCAVGLDWSFDLDDLVEIVLNLGEHHCPLLMIPQEQVRDSATALLILLRHNFAE
jgi:hypothetical protein